MRGAEECRRQRNEVTPVLGGPSGLIAVRRPSVALADVLPLQL